MGKEVGKLLEAEGYALVTPRVDRGTHSVVYQCRHRRRRPRRHSSWSAEAALAEAADELDEQDEGELEDEEEEELVRVKVLSESLPLPRHLTNFQHEQKVVEALTAAGVEGIVSVRARLSRPGLEALVLEDFGGRSLDRWLARDGAMAGDVDAFLGIALSVARTLGQVHGHSVVHRDIKPHNIIWNKATGVVKLADFGIASVVVRARDTTSGGGGGRVNLGATGKSGGGVGLPVQHIFGSLAYLPPELSLRHATADAAASVDYRSDFYSLGVTFFELLTGSTPFVEKSAVRMMHAHMAKQAPRVHDLDARIPVSVSAVVQRLLAKSVETRYQSSRGLVADLLRCRALLLARRAGGVAAEQAEEAEREFVAGAGDVSDVFSFPSTLYGRDEEIALLRRLYAEAATARAKSQVLLVAGYSGVGKTSLIGQLKNIKKHAYFISGKYDFSKRDVPYSGVVSAFTDMIHQILSESEENVVVLRERLQSAVGLHGQLLVYMIPSLELLIGEQPAVEVDLGMSELHALYSQLFTRLIDVFCSARPDYPLVMFLDDLHWADQPSLQLLAKIMSRTPSANSAPLLLVGGYRDNEVTSAAHPLWLFLDEIRKQSVGYNHIFLQPLDLANVNRMVSDVLHKNEPSEAMALSELVYEKTKGNPFYTISFLTKLHQTGLIWFDHGEGTWRWDLDKAQAMGYTDNVVEFMALELRKLPEQALALLEVAAYFGSQYDVRDIAEFRGETIEDVENLHWTALHQGFVLREGDFEYRFLHDRVQQAAYECVEAERSKQLHLAMAKFMMTRVEAIEDVKTQAWRRPQQQEGEEQPRLFDIFTVVYHYHEAADLMLDPAERVMVAQLSLKATIKGKNSMAYGMASKVAAQGIAMLPADRWDSHHKLTFQLVIEKAQCEYLAKKVEAAQQLFDELLANVRDVWETIEIYTYRNQMSTWLLHYEDMVASGLRGLAALGLDMPERPSEEMMAQAVAEVNELLRGRSIGDLLNAPPATDERAKASHTRSPLRTRHGTLLTGIQMLISKMATGFIFLNPLGYIYALATGIKISIQYGHIAHTSLIYVWYAWVGCAMKRRFDEAEAWGKLALDLVEKQYANSRFADRGEVWIIYYSFVHWVKHPLKDTIPGLEIGFKHAVAGGNHAMATGCAYNLMRIAWSTKPLSQIMSFIEPYLRYTEEVNWIDTLKMILVIKHYTLVLMDEAVEENEDQFFDYIQNGTQPMVLGQLRVNRLRYFYMGGRYHDAVCEAQDAVAVLPYITQFKEEVEYYYLYSLALLADCRSRLPAVTPKESMRMLGLTEWRRAEHKGRDRPRRRRRRQGRSPSDSSPETSSSDECEQLSQEEYCEHMAIVERNQANLKLWVDSVPGNFAHWHLLVTAEIERLALARETSSGGAQKLAQVAQLLETYERVSEMALENGFVQDAGLAKELSWQVLSEMAEQASAESLYCYRQWGAEAVVRERRGELVAAPIDSTTISTGAADVYSTTGVLTSAIDFEAVLQASQQLSSLLSTADLLRSAMELIMVNTGATKGVLLLTESAGTVSSGDSDSSSSSSGSGDALFVRARAKAVVEGPKVQIKNSLFTGDSPHLPNAIINFCWNSKSAEVITDAMADSRFCSDAYVNKRCARSVLCAPLSLKARFYGVIYIENHNRAGMFGPDRLRLLQVLAGQLVNSLENARLADELRRANSHMKRKNKKLQAMDQTKDDFLAVASHELRTPLTGVIGMAGLMADTKMTAHQEELLRDIDNESETLLQLVNDVLDLSKLKAKKVFLRDTTFDLEDCFVECLESVHNTTPTNGVSIRYETTKQVPQQITTDRTRLMQLITGLVRQALRIRNDDFIAREQRLSGDIVVSVSASEDEALEGKGGAGLISAERRNQLSDAGHQPSTLHIAVQGAGVMIREDEIAALLNPFARAAADSGAVSLPKLGCTSLGMHLCRELCSFFGGKLWGHADQHGAALHLAIPVGFGAKSVSRSGSRIVGQVERLFANKHVLVFVSSDTDGQLVQSYLAAAGMRVTKAARREDVVAHVEDAQETQSAAAAVDAVVVDLASLDKVQVYLLSQPRLVALVALASPAEVTDSRLLRELGQQYPLLRVVPLPVLRTRLLEQMRAILGAQAHAAA